MTIRDCIAWCKENNILVLWLPSGMVEVVRGPEKDDFVQASTFKKAVVKMVSRPRKKVPA